MARLIIIIALVVLGYFFIRWFKAEYAEKGRSFAVKTLLIGTAISLLILAGIGRVHWVGAALASLLAVARFVLPFALKGLPFLQQWRRQQYENQQQQNEAQQHHKRIDLHYRNEHYRWLVYGCYWHFFRWNMGE